MNGIFHTPESTKELEDWLKAQKDPLVTMAAIMTENLIRSQYELTPKK
jgi:hypothetical protein